MRTLWQLPGIGGRLHVYQLARFYRSLGMLLRGGMPVVPSLQHGVRPAGIRPARPAGAGLGAHP